MDKNKCICGEELTEMKNAEGEVTCKRCLACKPIVEPPKPKADETKYVDVAWTEERIRVLIRDELENWHKMTLVHKGNMTLTEVAAPDGVKEKVAVAGDVTEIPEGVEIPGTIPKWTDQAKELGISLMKETGGRRKKDDVLQDIENALTVKV